jgi:hypothetical protein
MGVRSAARKCGIKAVARERHAAGPRSGHIGDSGAHNKKGGVTALSVSALVRLPMPARLRL